MAQGEVRQQLMKNSARRKTVTHKETKARASEPVTSKVLAEGSEQFVPTDEQIRSRAYELYKARCDRGDSGDELTDWIAAECELRARGDGDQQTAPYEAASSATSRPWRPADHRDLL
jgi:hypothetical protein